MDLLCHAIGVGSETQDVTADPAPQHQEPACRESASSSRSGPVASEFHPMSPPSRSTPNRQCHVCGRSYERADHLNRHLKSHENARPHKCTHCNKSFNRADLLNRHQAGHSRSAADQRSIERGTRVAAACIACVNAKAKCQDQKPCTRCQLKKIPCEMIGNNSQLNGGQSDSSAQKQEDTHKPKGHEDPNTLSKRHSADDSSGNSMPEGTGLESTLVIHDMSTNNFQYNMNASNSTYNNDLIMSSNLDPSFLAYQDFASLPADGQFSPGLGLIPRNSYFSQDLDFGMWDFDLDSVEYACLGDHNTGSGETDLTQSPNPQSRPPKDASKRYAAFLRSPWLWTPTKNDQALNDQHDLVLDEDKIPSVLTPASPASSMDEFASCCIYEKERDQILSLLFTLPRYPTKSPRLPSLPLLNSIIQVYFVQESFKVDQLIHIGTFTPAKVLPPLLVAIVAAGSSLISTPAIWKMGLALQEVVRNSVPNYWEEDNSHTRNLQSLQAFMIALDVGLWSGFKRKMEIAESFAQPIVIMLRRAGAFTTPENQLSVDPRYEDSEAVLESKWKKWSERESFKRLVLHLFIHDIQASMGFQKPPLISITELKFLLPAARNLWLAKSHTEWQDLYLSSLSQHPIPTFAEAIHQPNLHQLSAQIDIPLTTIALLHGHWGQIYSLNESKKFFPSSKSTHRLWLHTAYTELYQDLSSFSLLIPSLTNNTTEATLIAEFLQMTLHTSPEDLHRFAGKFGEDETQKAAEDFVVWSKTKEARIAIWHAGQVFRAARALRPAQNRGFNAVVLYYATLTLWVYGHMISSTESSLTAVAHHPSPSTGTQSVILNEPETSSVTLFLASSQGIPFLSVQDGDVASGRTLVALAEPDKVLHVARDIYRSNYPLLEEKLPPLVENLCILLKDLGSLPGSRISRAPSEGDSSR